MADRVSKEVRSWVMSRVRATQTGPEIAFRKALWAAGVRGWRKNFAAIQGKPDVVFLKKRIAVFVDGCFWHGCPACYRQPNSNKDYWKNKITRNVARDRFIDNILREQGWILVRVWEHAVHANIGACVGKVLRALRIADRRLSGKRKRMFVVPGRKKIRRVS